MSKEIIKETGISGLKLAINAIPYIGPVITEFAIEARGRIKQNRLNQFTVEFSKYIQQFQEVELEMHQIQTEEFGDFFEQVITKVVKNRSIIKREAFKKLLANQLLKPIDIDYAELLCDIIGDLHEKQIPILANLFDTDPLYIDLKKQILEKQDEKISYDRQLRDLRIGVFSSADDSMLTGKIKSLNKEITKLIEECKGYSAPYSPETYGIQQHEFYYLVQDLCNKGLLTDIGTSYGAEPYTLVDINQLGIDLIKTIS